MPDTQEKLRKVKAEIKSNQREENFLKTCSIFRKIRYCIHEAKIRSKNNWTGGTGGGTMWHLKKNSVFFPNKCFKFKKRNLILG